MAQRRSAARPAMHGDVTGRNAQALRDENQQALAARQREMSTVGQVETDDGVTDLTSEAILAEMERDDAEHARLEAEGTNVAPFGSPFQVMELPEPKRARRGRLAIDADELESDVIFRASEDLDDMTYGVTQSGSPFTFTMKANRRYKISGHVADHLAEKGLGMVLTR